MTKRQTDKGETSDLNPEDFLRALLKISPEDAKQAREDAAKATEPDEGDK